MDEAMIGFKGKFRLKQYMYVCKTNTTMAKEEINIYCVVEGTVNGCK
jgi:hypothetical protein